MPLEIPSYSLNEAQPIPEQGTWPRSIHQFDEDTVAALRAAEATGRPLLVRGVPGVGKSQTARAAAAAANRPFLSVVIDGRTEPHDLKWRFDAVQRLSDAQSKEPGKDLPPELEYLVPQALWWAYNWNSAESQVTAAKRIKGIHRPASPEDWTPECDRVVLLIDEIDKADPDLPNALLEVLGNKGFSVPYSDQVVTCTEDTRPLVLITTNEERELPDAFLRRCLVLQLNLPEGDALIEHLIKLGEQHRCFERGAASLGEEEKEKVLKEAAHQVVRIRKEALDHSEYLPGTSEYLDLLRAAERLHPGNIREQSDAIKQLGKFALIKSNRVSR